ncbi:MAG: FKBP-type peptidyl-prolyl cis-trans isomerase [Wolbachia sp.]|nr:FKBP-type peptidyl-prolyl cis-trans isomerase [Wolbachia sp.]MDD9336613.1 FKBP-type peptidyl-prolyl cis-trans isomerase [Wolbachia sp.]
MIKKAILQVFIFIIIVFVLTAAFILIVANINKNKLEKSEKHYEINSAHEGLVQTIAYYLVKPILESALDRYIEKHDLVEYLEEIRQQKENTSTNFYEITEGNGSRAFCGQEVLLQIYKMSNNDLTTSLPLVNQVSDVTLEIGKNKLKELSLGVIGMKEGGERVVMINNSTDNDKANPRSYYVKLIEIKEKYPDSINNLMVFDNLTSKAGKQVKCGDEISVKYSVREYNGEPRVENKTVQFAVGGKEVPLAMELGVIGMRASNNRTIISPPDILTITDDMLIKDIDFDEENISIIDLSLE